MAFYGVSCLVRIDSVRGIAAHSLPRQLRAHDASPVGQGKLGKLVLSGENLFCITLGPVFKVGQYLRYHWLQVHR